MDIDAKQAATALQEIAGAEQRTRQSLVFANASASLVLWGVLVIAGNLAEFTWPQGGAAIWIGLNAIGLVGTLVLVRFGPSRGCADQRGTRVVQSLLVLAGFGLVWSLLIGGFTPRQLAVFWPTLFMCGYVIAGIWLGRFFIVLGLSVTALALAGYFWLGPWLPLWMAVCNGGGLLAGGLWLRRLG